MAITMNIDVFVKNNLLFKYKNLYLIFILKIRL